MQTAAGLTRYASLTRLQALLVLACTALSMVWCLAVAPRNTLIPKSYNNKDQGDMAVYQAVVKRIQGGAGYYDALGTELRAANRPTASIFNWRTPLYLPAIAWLPSLAWGRAILAIAALAALGLAFIVMGRSEMPFSAVFEVLLMLGPLMVCFAPPGVFFAEVWAGVLIAVSATACGLGWRRVGVPVGLLALFVRELALPYVLVSAFLAWRAKRRSEVWAWTAGLGAYAIYFTVHALIVRSHITPADFANPAAQIQIGGMSFHLTGWIQFGGLDFLLRASSVGWLMLLPPWVTALYLPAALLGLGGWTHPTARYASLTVACYMVAFAVMGYTMNLYWGAVYAPLLTFGAACAAPAFRDLAQAVLQNRQPPSGTEPARP